MSGPTFLSFHMLNFLVWLAALGLPCEETREVIDGLGSKPNFLKKIARNH